MMLFAVVLVLVQLHLLLSLHEAREAWKPPAIQRGRADLEVAC